MDPIDEKIRRHVLCHFRAAVREFQTERGLPPPKVALVGAPMYAILKSCLEDHGLRPTTSGFQIDGVAIYERPRFMEYESVFGY